MCVCVCIHISNNYSWTEQMFIEMLYCDAVMLSFYVCCLIKNAWIANATMSSVHFRLSIVMSQWIVWYILYIIFRFHFYERQINKQSLVIVGSVICTACLHVFVIKTQSITGAKILHMNVIKMKRDDWLSLCLRSRHGTNYSSFVFGVLLIKYY